jgi:TetR/AcrR family transcriptional repressor of bet genes
MTTTIQTRKKASREVRREQLIDATIATIARQGIARTTLTDVANAAGVSHGLVIFYFESKEKLFAETVRFMSEAYRHAWSTAIEAAPPDPASHLDAMIEANFSEGDRVPDWLSTWISFWTETEARPIYFEICNADDRAYMETLEDICDRLIQEGGYALDATRTARVLRLTIEGVWIDLMFPIKAYSRDEALTTVYYAAATFFPRHFDINGPIRR